MGQNDVLKNSNAIGIPFSINEKKKFYFFIKRIFDIIVGVIGSILIIPLAIIIKIAYLFHKDYAPIIFRQERIGQNGKIIKIYKFRSMVPNAEKVLENLMKSDSKIRKEYLNNKKLEHDPRLTRVGKIIRRTSIDEFPQFFNVLKGEMSLIGPRPYLLREKDDMEMYYNEIVACKPGITGLWQVSGRSDLSFKYRLKLDRIYYLQRTIRFDLIIAYKTFGAVFNKNGAK